MLHYYIKEYFRLDEEGRRRLFAVIAKAVIWFSGCVALLCFVALFIYEKFFNPTLSFPIMPYLAMMVFSLPLTGLYYLQLAEYRIKKEAGSYFRLSCIYGVLGVLLTVLFVVLLKWGAFGKLLAPLVCHGAIFLFLLWQFRDVLKLRTSFAEFKTVFIFCVPLALSAMLGYFTNGFSTTYLESVGKTTEYGYYVVGASIATYLATFSQAVGNTFQPDLYQSTIKHQWHRFAKFCALQIGAIIIIALIFIICAPFIISLLTAGRYTASAPFAQIIAFSVITSGIYNLINNFSIATNRPRHFLYTSILGSIFVVCAMPYFVDRWEFYGGAWMTVLSFVVFSAINLILLVFSKPDETKTVTNQQ